MPKSTDKNWNTNNAFWSKFGGIGMVEWVKSARAGGADESFWRDEMAAARLSRASNEGGHVKIEHIKTGGLHLADLKTDASDDSIMYSHLYSNSF